MSAVVIVSTIAVMLLAAGAVVVLRPASLAPETLARDFGGAPSKFVTLPGGTVARYQDFSADTDGATLLLLHGGTVSLESWSPWIERLRGTRRIVAVDLPGHGLTGATMEGNYGPEGMVAFLESLVHELGLRQPFVLAGHSMGGHVAWRFALRHPALVKKLVLVSPGGLAAPGGPQARAIDLASRPGGAWIVRLATSRARLADGLKQVFHVKEAVTQTMVDRTWAMSLRTGSQDATIKRLQAPSFDPAAIARLGGITAPVLLLWGRDDVVFPLQLAGTFQKAVPSARLISYEACGHFPHEELPDRTATDVQAFLQQ